jgi:cell division protease FtsH
MMGSERRSMVITEKEKRNTAYHEAGHALIALLLPGADPVHKVSIIPRGRALGVTMYLPQEEKYNEDQEGLETLICTLMGGRVAEEIVFGVVTSGASNDIERATNIARKMVCEWGMSLKIGPLSFGDKEGEIFLGRDFGHTKNYSEETAIVIDNEIRDIVLRNYNRTKELLSSHREHLETIAQALLERETVEGAEIRRIVFGEEEAQQAESGQESPVGEGSSADSDSPAEPVSEPEAGSEEAKPGGDA